MRYIHAKALDNCDSQIILEILVVMYAIWDDHKYHIIFEQWIV